MKHSILAVVLLALIIKCEACAVIPTSYLGTVQQGCTPGAITSVTQLLTDPSKCNLPLAGGGCNLCKLNLYKPEKTTSRFLVQPLAGDFSTTTATHVEATQCKCSEGCYFHESSITKFGNFPLPSGLTAVGKFSEPFACFSGISMKNEVTPSFTFLIWCESDGGCPNPVVARYSFVIRFELLSPNRPNTKSTFIAKITTLPPPKCLIDQIDDKTKKFIMGDGTKGKTPSKTPKGKGKGKGKAKSGECARCKRDKDCLSGVCFKNKCLRSESSSDKERCGIASPGSRKCDAAERITSCVSSCLSSV